MITGAAKGADPDTGDGAGILTQIPDRFYRAACGFPLPEPGGYAAGIAFLAPDHGEAAAETVRRISAQEGLRVLGWRDVPHDPAACGPGARALLPRLRQLFVAGVAHAHVRDIDRWFTGLLGPGQLDALLGALRILRDQVRPGATAGV